MRCSVRILAIKFDSCQQFNVLISSDVINLEHFPYLGGLTVLTIIWLMVKIGLRWKGPP